MPPMSWHGKAEEPMVLGGREGSAVALDARQPSLWTSVVRQGVVCSCAAVADVFWQLSAAMRHAGLVGTAAAGDVAEPMQIEPYDVGIGPLGSKFTVLSVCGACVAISSRRRDLWVLWSFVWRDLRIARSGAGHLPRPYASTHLKTTELTVPRSIAQRNTAWAQPHHHAAVPTRPACRMAAESCQNTSAAAAQLQATPCQPRSSKVKAVERKKQRRTLRDRPAPPAPLLCLASSLAAV